MKNNNLKIKRNIAKSVVLWMSNIQELRSLGLFSHRKERIYGVSPSYAKGVM